MWSLGHKRRRQQHQQFYTTHSRLPSKYTREIPGKRFVVMYIEINREAHWYTFATTKHDNIDTFVSIQARERGGSLCVYYFIHLQVLVKRTLSISVFSLLQSVVLVCMMTCVHVNLSIRNLRTRPTNTPDWEKKFKISTRHFGLHTLHHRSLDWNRLGRTPHRDAVRLTHFIFSLGTKWVFAIIKLHDVFEAPLIKITCQKHVDRIRVIHVKCKWVPRSCIECKVRDALLFIYTRNKSFDCLHRSTNIHSCLKTCFSFNCTNEKPLKMLLLVLACTTFLLLRYFC